MADAEQSYLTTLTVDLLSAYVANNNVEHGAIPDLIRSTHAALKIIDTNEPPAPEESEHKPAVSVRKSLGSPNHIISLIDGKPYQTLKRHLSKHNLTPEQYRERYSLPKTYPMVAPAYSENRRAIAERLGLGKRVKGAQEQTPSPAPVSDAAAPEPAAKSAAKPAAAKVAKAAPARASTKAAAKSSTPTATPASPAKAKAPRKTAAVEGTTSPAPSKRGPKPKAAGSAKPDVAKPTPDAPKPAPQKRGPKRATAAS